VGNLLRHSFRVMQQSGRPATAEAARDDGFERRSGRGLIRSATDWSCHWPKVCGWYTPVCRRGARIWRGSRSTTRCSPRNHLLARRQVVARRGQRLQPCGHPKKKNRLCAAERLWRQGTPRSRRAKSTPRPHLGTEVRHPRRHQARAATPIRHRARDRPLEGRKPPRPLLSQRLRRRCRQHHPHRRRLQLPTYPQHR
jgi:hypothetical protein